MRANYIHPQRPITIDDTSDASIGYFGDSFCADSVNQSSLCNILAKKLRCGVITHWGVGGTSVWYMMLRFMDMHRKKTLPRNIIIVYTEHSRIYHPEKILPINHASETSHTELERSCDLYLKNLDFDNLNRFRYTACVQWFDQNILRELTKDHNILQAFGFDAMGIKLTSGHVLDYTFQPLHQKNLEAGMEEDQLINHLTAEQNIMIAEDIYRKFSSVSDKN